VSASTLSPSNGPAAVLLLKLDTLGDLVVFAPVLRALRAAWPQARLAVVLRRAYLDLAPLLADGIEWIPTTLDPFSHGPEADPAEVQRLREIAAGLAPAAVGAATSRRNWLEAAVASAVPAARRVALGTAAEDEHFATRLRVTLGLDAAGIFPERLALDPAAPDWKNNFLLADALLGRAVERVAPALSAPAATGLLAKLGLTRGRYAVCAAAGFANVRLKTWPADRFAACIGYLHTRHGLPTILIGHESERAHLESVISHLPSSISRAVWLGRDGDLPLLAELIAGSALYLGNDTGAMHLAAALDVPVVAVFGGGTWPRFVPAARRGVALVHPLPCFGCGWDCAFGDAPCLGDITVADATAALDRALASSNFEIAEVQHRSAGERALIEKISARHRAAAAGHLARQHKLEELTALDREKDAEIAALKAVCDEREKVIFTLDGHVRHFQAAVPGLQAELDVHRKTLAALPADAAKAAKTIHDLVVHTRNIEAMLTHRDAELKELRISLAQRAAGHHDVENAKHYGRLLAERELALQFHRESLAARDATIAQLADEEIGPLRKSWLTAHSWWSAKIAEPFDQWLFKMVVENYWMQIGILRHYAPRPLKWDERLTHLPSPLSHLLPPVAVVTPSYGQEKFIERTLRSVLDQNYPRLLYAVQDGASQDRSPEIIAAHAARLHHWESVKDAGQADAIRRGFAHLAPALTPGTIMAWLNSDDLLAPGALRFVAGYFAAHPEVDVLYGHRIIIDDDDRDVGRWIMPRHDPATLEWIDYVPQETLFWRKRAWDLVGGIDPSFQFALDWDLLARFQQAGCRMVRVPYFLGAFRVHAEQKTSQAIHTTGAEEMRRIRTRFHGERQDDAVTIHRHARHARFWGAIAARLHAVGIRW
jgi:ADP-heptose:LPS heptosyltransferase/GT2 family glycosyltransferase